MEAYSTHPSSSALSGGSSLEAYLSSYMSHLFYVLTLHPVKGSEVEMFFQLNQLRYFLPLGMLGVMQHTSMNHWHIWSTKK